MDRRQLKALEIAASTKLEPDGGRWVVPTQTGQGRYYVTLGPDGWECTCEDWQERRHECKHSIAVDLTIERENGGKPVDFGDLVKVTYSRDWPAYVMAQTREGEHFPELLASLCALVPQPPHTTGRPRLPLSDMAFAAVMRAFVGVSARRFASALRDARKDGHIEVIPSTTSFLRYVADPALTPILGDLIVASSKPMATIEQFFAVDASGFRTNRRFSWYSHKHGRKLTSREWVKLHLTAGTHTHIVTDATVTEWYMNDSPLLEAMIGRTAETFDVREVSADKAYLSHKNVGAIERVGAVPFIPFKTNSVRPNEGTPWARMYHYYSYRRGEFLGHYHHRSNVETVFSMVKAKFGESLLSKSHPAQVNEVLCRVVAHNICVLIKSWYELGIDPTMFFSGADARPAA